MMKSEFEQRIKLEITSEEYAQIEPLYMNDPKNRDKDAFCKAWLKDGGIQWLLDRRQNQIKILTEQLAETIKTKDEEITIAENRATRNLNELMRIKCELLRLAK